VYHTQFGKYITQKYRISFSVFQRQTLYDICDIAAKVVYLYDNFIGEGGAWLFV